MLDTPCNCFTADISITTQDDAASRSRIELRKRDEAVAEVEKELRSAQRQVAAKEPKSQFRKALFALGV